MASKGPLKIASIVVITLVLVAATIFGMIQVFSHFVLPAVSPAIEKQLVRLVMLQLETEHTIVRDNTRVNAALDAIRARLLPNIPADGAPVDPTFLLVVDGDISAYAYPGSVITISSGLIRIAASAEELTAVIAHELGHLYHRDVMNTLMRSIGITLVIAILVGGDTAQLVAQIAQELVERKYSREQETRADEFAFSLLRRSGISPVHLAEIFRRMHERQQELLRGAGLPVDLSRIEKYFTYISTHPDIVSRIKRAREAAATDPAFRPRKIRINWSRVQRSVAPQDDEE